MNRMTREKSKQTKQIKYLFVNKCCVCLCFSFITVDWALQGVDDMVVGVVFVVVQNTVVCIVFSTAWIEKDMIKVTLRFLMF